jgi:starch synthase
MVINGVGEDQYKIFFQEAQNKYPGRLAFKPELNIVYSHKVAAGADIMLVPSLYEPCGLNQLYGFRYGTVPVVRSTGGLKEMVKAYHHEKGDGNGFVFKEYSPTALAKIIEEAVSFYKKPLIWRKIIANGFNQDCSWKKAARKYERLYNKIINLKRGGQIV